MNHVYIPSELVTSSQVVYSEHDFDECFEYKDNECNAFLQLKGRVPEGVAIGYLAQTTQGKGVKEELILFEDIQYSEYDHPYWDNYELEHDASRVVVG